MTFVIQVTQVPSGRDGYYTGGGWSGDIVDAARYRNREAAALIVDHMPPGECLLRVLEVADVEAAFACTRCGSAVPHCHESQGS